MKNFQLLIIIFTEELITYFHTRFNTPAEIKLEDLSPQNLIIFTIISNLLVPTDGHRTDANKMKLYLFYCFVENVRIDFGFVMYKFLFKLSTDSHRQLSYEKIFYSNFCSLQNSFHWSISKRNLFLCFHQSIF